jgi:predicted nucleotidyltransferase
MSRLTVARGPDASRRARLEAELARIVRELPQLGVRKAILFGSLASGRVGRASDLDLILVAPSGEPFGRRPERFYRALSPSVALDLFVYTPEEFGSLAECSRFLRAALAHGRVVYEA